jgi:hypothetical protein
MTWQPIETAPKDGSEIIVHTVHEADEYMDRFIAVQIAFWDRGHDSSDPMWARPAAWVLQKIGDPTHWMPLPEPPVSRS